MELRTSFGPFCFVRDNLAYHWNFARKFIVPSIEFSHGALTEADVYQSLANGNRHLVVGQESALIWEDPGFAVKTIHFYLCGGNLREILEASPIIYGMAREAGFRRAYVSGRRGWKRLLPNFKEYCTTYTMDL